MNSPLPPTEKASWPLFLVAGLSFIPFLGILFGAAGATWGLVSSRRKAVLAAVISLAGALLNIAGMFALVAFEGGKSGGMSQIWVEASKVEMAQVVVDLEKYHDKEHAYPAALRDLPGYSGALRMGKLLDQSAGPFTLQHELQYVVADDGESYDLFGTGPDNKLGTADDVRPKLSDSLKEHSGFRPQPASTIP